MNEHEVQQYADYESRLEAAILDIDAHATALGTDEQGFVTGGYVISVGSLHRALGVVGHTAPLCPQCKPESHDCKGKVMSVIHDALADRGIRIEDRLSILLDVEAKLVMEENRRANETRDERRLRRAAKAAGLTDVRDLLTDEEKAKLDADLAEMARQRRRAEAEAANTVLGNDGKES